MATHLAYAEQSERGVDILGVKVGTQSLSLVAADVVRWASAEGHPTTPRYVCATSVHGLIQGVRDPAFRSILNHADHIVPDGMPLVWFGRLSGFHAMQRVRGPSLMWEVCHRTARLPMRHFLYGGAPEVAEALRMRLCTEFPGIQVVGVYSPPFRALSDDELMEVVARINATGAEIVWVGLSTPKQAPSWMQGVGLEWLFRLFQEPGRLWRRYAYNNPRFLWLALLQLAGLKKFTNVDQAGRADAA